MKGWHCHIPLVMLLLIFSTPRYGLAKLVRYELTATQEKVNLSGQMAVDFAIAVNKTIPAPTLTFTEGDDAEIIVQNRIPDQELSIHWHGILLPVEMDGVPYVTTPPIKSGESFTFKFRLRQSGTYWYHSHTMLQEQKGVFGAIVIHPKNPKFSVTHDSVAVLSDWTDENPDAVLRNLKKDGDYYLHKKGSIRSYFGALGAGALGTLISNEWARMGGMDLSDVGYDAFLINGKRTSQLLSAKRGDRVRLRVINAAASSYFKLSLGNLPMKVISADGIDIEPIEAKEILIGMAETYDILFSPPEDKNYEFRALAQDGTGSASVWIGAGGSVPAPSPELPNLYQSMDHSQHQRQASPPKDGMAEHHHSHSGMGHGPTSTLTVDSIRSATPTRFRSENSRQEVELVLDGDMSRYVWHVNGKTISQDRNIVVKEGDVVQFKFINHSMMHHPMHLHGHFFRVLTDAGDRSPLKHTVDVPPHGVRTIEFLAVEPGEWMLHCHNLYHLKSGMARVVKYLSYTPRPEIAHWQKHDPHEHDHLYFSGSILAANNIAEGKLKFSQTWNELELRGEGRSHSNWEVEGDAFARHWFGNFWSAAAGVTRINEEFRVLGGVSVLLPMLIQTQLTIDHRGDLRLDLGKRFQWTSSIFTEVELRIRQRLDSDFLVSLMYAPNWAWAIGANYTGHDFGAMGIFRF